MKCGIEYFTQDGLQPCIRPQNHKGGHSAFTVVVSDETKPTPNAYQLDVCRRAADHLREAVTLLLLLPPENTDAFIFTSELKPMIKRAEGLVQL